MMRYAIAAGWLMIVALIITCPLIIIQMHKGETSFMEGFLMLLFIFVLQYALALNIDALEKSHDE